MYSRLQNTLLSIICLVLGLAGSACGQAPAVQAVAPLPAATANLHGHITDPTGALIAGAKIAVNTIAGAEVKTTTADATGVFQVNGLAPGSYVVHVSFEGFAPFASPAISLAAGQAKRLDISLAMAVEQESVIVSDESQMVNVEAGGNASSIVLKGKDLEALSDDPDELSNELQALAGPSAGPNGGQIYIDGFSGGQLPPKSAIREIRINQNPFSAEFDRLGYGRIEILTKPGTDKLHGQAFIQGNHKVFNTGNPFTTDIPSYFSYQFNGTLSGAISKTASFFVSAEQRNTDNVNTWQIPNAVMPEDPNAPASATNLYQDNIDYGVSLLNQRIRDNASARIDWQLGAKNTLTARYGFWAESEHNNLNQQSLPSASTHESNTDHTVQISDAIILNEHAVNETRFQFERQNENHYPDSGDATINVAGNFTGGGYSGQQYRDHTTRMEFWNLTTLSHGAHAIKFGTRMRDSRDANFTNANFNGSYTFAPVAITTAGETTQYTSSEVYKYVANQLITQGKTFQQLYQDGWLAKSSVSFVPVSSSGSTLANMFDVALFAQDDWKLNSRLTLSGGIRWEAQNHVADHNDLAPRVALAYALDGGKDKKKTKTVLRAGYGFFYDRFGTGNLLTIDRSVIQPQTVIYDPNCTGAVTLESAANLDSCTAGAAGSAPPAVKYEVNARYRSPYTGQAGVSLERQLLPGTSLTVTYLHSFGVHQMATRNANQSVGGTPQTDSGGYIYEFYPEAVFKQSQVITSVNGKLGKNLTLMGSYTAAWANSNTGNAVNAYDLDDGYGRAGFVSRNMLFMMGSYNAPWGIHFNPFIVAQSGRPYNVTLASDQLNNFGNQRPGIVTDGSLCSSQGNTGRYVQTTGYGCLDTQPVSSEQLLPVNAGNGPAAVAVNLRISRAVGIGPKLASATTGQDGGGPPPGGGPPGGGRGGGGPGGGLGPGGLGGGGGRGGPGGMFGPTSTGHKYSLNFSVQALNLFNNIDYGTPNGTIIPTQEGDSAQYNAGPQFGKSTSLAGGVFSVGSASRRIFGQVVFSF